MAQPVPHVVEEAAGVVGSEVRRNGRNSNPNMIRRRTSRWEDSLATEKNPKTFLDVPEGALHQEDSDWLLDISDVIHRRLGTEPRCQGLVVNISDLLQSRVDPPGGSAEAEEFRAFVASWPGLSGRGFVRRLFTGARCFTVSSRVDEELYRAWVSALPRRETKDAFCVSACVEPGDGVLLWFSLPERTRVSRRVLAVWERVASGLLTTLRGRRSGLSRTSAPPVSATVAVASKGLRGKRKTELVAQTQVVCAAVRASAALLSALPDLDEARAKQFRSELVRGQWRLVDHFDANGRRHIVFFRTEARLEKRYTLTAREREVLQRVAEGQGDRATATEFGCAPSTIATHRLRAMSKLGIETRTLLSQVLASVGSLTE
jgi:DNA-binding CsgD family transcriptional regulator